MRVLSSAATAAALAVTTLANTADALDLFTGASPWELIATVADRASRNGKSADENSDQVFMRCGECVGLAASLSSGEDTLTLPLPHHDGSISRFTLKKTTDAVIAEDLQAQFPDAQTYYGRNNKGVTVEVDTTLAGGVRVQYHGRHGELSYLDHVRADDPDLSMTSADVQNAVATNVPVFRVYRRVAGQRASEILASPEFKCSTTEARTPKASKASNSARRLQVVAPGTCAKPIWFADFYCDVVNNVDACGYDGGDCCGRDVDLFYCTEAEIASGACDCNDPSYTTVPDANGCVAVNSGDGFCDANNNIAACDNDGEDCCGVFLSDRTFCEGDNCGCPVDAEFTSFPGHTYRMAVGTSKGYSQFHGNTIPTVLAEVLTAVNRIGGIYKRSLNIGLQLFGNTTQLFELNNTDVVTNFDEDGEAISSATAIFEEKLGSVDGFDIGHIFFGTGNSYVTGRVCSADKANGGSGSARPVADGYYVDYLAHEVGHQFSGGHTWTGSSCAAGHFVQGSGVEPGSGATIMAYAGICGPDNVQSASDPYFALVSLEEIHSFSLSIFNGNSCGVAAPEVTAPKLAPRLAFPQGKCQIPSNTSFVLSPQVNDILLSAKEGALLSYSWEQADVATVDTPIGAKEFGPIFRSQVPIEEPVRYFPSPASVISGQTIPGEPLEWPDRNFRFSLTVRDTWQLESDSLDGQTDLSNGRGSYAADYVEVLTANVDPFVLQSAGAEGAAVTVSWDTTAVASLWANGGASSETKVSLSYDNAETFSTPSLFKFTDGEANVLAKACVDGQGNHNGVAVLVEVESVAGCSFYVVEIVGDVACGLATTSAPSSTPTSSLSPTTGAPSSTPTTGTPSLAPTTKAPSSTPTTGAPSLAPTTKAPSSALTTDAPSSTPTKTPSSTPSFAPTSGPTNAPSSATTLEPTNAPVSTTTSGTNAPSSATPSGPTNSPSYGPSFAPTSAPTNSPTKLRSAAPTIADEAEDDSTIFIIAGAVGGVALLLTAVVCLKKNSAKATMTTELRGPIVSLEPKSETML